MSSVPWLRAVPLGLICAATAIGLAGCPVTNPNGPTAGFQADSLSGPAPLTVQFTDLSMPGAEITSWLWLFGDGTTSTEKSPSHTYEEVGTYNVSLEVTTADGEDTELKLNYITVDEPVVSSNCETGTFLGEEQTFMLPGDVPLTMVRVPGGCYVMGGMRGGNPFEQPPHEVNIGPFWIGKYEVTKRQWVALMGTTPWEDYDYGDVLDDPDSPAVFVTRGEAVAFVDALTDHVPGRIKFRLPSESRWEMACRAGTTTRFYWGDDPTYTEGDDYAWWLYTSANLTEPGAQVVGQKLPNAWGLYDMAGNAAEWCLDMYHPDYVGAPSNGSVWFDSTTDLRVVRGGSFLDVDEVRSAAREFYRVGRGYPGIGFRVTY